MDWAMLLSVLVVVPVFALTIGIAWRYRETNPRPKKYTPEWDRSKLLESIWWGIPSLIILVLCVITWISSHTLDPYRALPGGKALRIQVVAMDWKWLFIYPDQHVASVNELYMPVDQPVHFDITSDTVMNSFWIPSLGSQIYAMPGMTTQLNLIANKPGSYYGTPANINGTGFAGMTFTAKAGSRAAFDRWVRSAQQANNNLTQASYAALARPSTYNKVAYYSPVQDDLYQDLVLKYMAHMSMSRQEPAPLKDGKSHHDSMHMMEASQ